jgi:hypothetical protein
VQTSTHEKPLDVGQTHEQPNWAPRLHNAGQSAVGAGVGPVAHETV